MLRPRRLGAEYLAEKRGERCSILYEGLEVNHDLGPVARSSICSTEPAE